MTDDLASLAMAIDIKLGGKNFYHSHWCIVWLCKSLEKTIIAKSISQQSNPVLR